MKYLDIAIELAREMGQIQLDGLGRVHHVEYKGATNIVTEIDKKCERLFIDRIQKEFPSHEILGEEGGQVKSMIETKDGYCWIVDPLDGTVNYAHNYPLFAVSIALEYKKDIVFGVVFEPNRNELFVAERGSGATLNDRRIKVSNTTDLRKALLDTGFAYNIHEGEKRNNLNNFEKFLFESRAIRRDGAAASDLCYVACGRFDGFWELFLKPWDIAAGQLIIKEAGGRVSSFDGSPLDLYGTEILASNGKIHEQMMEVLCQKKQ